MNTNIKHSIYQIVLLTVYIIYNIFTHNKIKIRTFIRTKNILNNLSQFSGLYTKNY